MWGGRRAALRLLPGRFPLPPPAGPGSPEQGASSERGKDQPRMGVLSAESKHELAIRQPRVRQ
jgi:hypothetical protein